MILDFLKKHWIFFFILMGVNLIAIAIVNSTSLEFYIKFSPIAFVFFTAVYIYIFIGSKNGRVAWSDEMMTVTVLVLLLYFSVNFFMFPEKRDDYGAPCYLISIRNFVMIFFARKFNVSGTLFKKSEDENP